jgi:hypothetical protein
MLFFYHLLVQHLRKLGDAAYLYILSRTEVDQLCLWYKVIL